MASSFGLLFMPSSDNVLFRIKSDFSFILNNEFSDDGLNRRPKLLAISNFFGVVA
jgi:hypothetical protein